MKEPLAYFITFHTLGTWFHGDERGSVDRQHKHYGTPFAAPDAARRNAERRSMHDDPVTLDGAARNIVRHAILRVCEVRGWYVHALHVRTTHIHIVVTAAGHQPERVMSDMKAYATRRLREANFAPHRSRGHIWSRHGSTRYLWTPQAVHAKIDYTLNQQGVALSNAVYAPNTDDGNSQSREA